MSRYRIYIIFLIIVSVGLSGLFLVSRGYYPIALVDGEFVSARRFVDDYNAALLYYNNFLKTYKPNAEESEKISPSDLQLAVIGNIIERVLISHAARKEAGSDLDVLIAGKIDKYLGDPQLAQAASALYGWNMEDFKKNVLVPQAEREILLGRFFLRAQNFETWFSETKRSVTVYIFSPRFEWNGEAVVRKT